MFFQRIISFTQRAKTRRIIIYSSFIILFILALFSIFEGGMAFWFDPARDFLMAWDNLKKLTLIGAPTGIPGFFYGPYWIWLISFGLIFSKNPQIVTLIILTLPYLILFPLILNKFRIFSKNNVFIILWILFFFQFSSYFLSPWNPHPAPLLILLEIYLLVKIKNYNILNLLILGLIAGLITNFQFSFGLGVILGIFLFILIKLSSGFIKLKKPSVILNNFKLIFSYILGILIAYLPSIIFELRHGGNQIKSIWKAFSDSFFYNSASVGVTGLTKKEVIIEFFKRGSSILNINFYPYANIIIYSVILIALIGFIYAKKIKLLKEEKKIIGVFITVSVSVLFLFISSKNPVWIYHFIGTEIFFMLLLGIILNKIYFLRVIFYFWTIYILFTNIINILTPSIHNPYAVPSIKAKERILDVVYTDANKERFTILIYSPAIYTYDFDYLLNWYGKSKYSYLPDRELLDNKIVYLVIPLSDKEIVMDYINYKTPKDNFITEKSWEMTDGTLIFKRYKN